MPACFLEAPECSCSKQNAQCDATADQLVCVKGLFDSMRGNEGQGTTRFRVWVPSRKPAVLRTAPAALAGLDRPVQLSPRVQELQVPDLRARQAQIMLGKPALLAGLGSAPPIASQRKG